jgi:hypothetical protein
LEGRKAIKAGEKTGGRKEGPKNLRKEGQQKLEKTE